MTRDDVSTVPHVVCEHVAHMFRSDRGNVLALQDVSLSIGRREFVCVVGPSGCGKSTLLRSIAGLQQPSGGRVLVDGAPAAGRVRGGLVVQEHGTFPWMTVTDNVAFGLEMAGVSSPLSSRLVSSASIASSPFLVIT